MLTEIRGTFVKIAFADQVDVVLKRGSKDRPAARFNRPGQDALYLSPDEDSARVAIGQYVQAEDRSRVLLRFDVSECKLCDLRRPEASGIYDLAKQPWISALERGEDPTAWTAADTLRDAGHIGLIDPSRQSPGTWHVTLFHWNTPGAPQVRPVGQPVPIELEPCTR